MNRTRTCRLVLELLEDRNLPSALSAAPTLTSADTAAAARVNQNYGQLPLSFELNQGQADAPVNFLAHGPGHELFLTPTGAIMALNQGSAVAGQGSAQDVLRMQLVGANPPAQPTGLDQLPGVSNYLIGNDPSQWHTNIPNFARVEYQNVYPGINLVYYDNQRQLEYDFVVAPGADPNNIRIGVRSLPCHDYATFFVAARRC
jgi:hypothetical protein